MWSKMSTIYSVCVLKIRDRRGSEAPAGRETSRRNIYAWGNKRGYFPFFYFHVRIFLQTFTLPWSWDLIRCFSLVLCLKASAQIQTQTSKSSSIILALTDGKLAVYVHELTVKEVRFTLLNTCLALSVKLMSVISSLDVLHAFNVFYFLQSTCSV